MNLEITEIFVGVAALTVQNVHVQYMYLQCTMDVVTNKYSIIVSLALCDHCLI